MILILNPYLIALDLETTGKDHYRDEIIEYAAVRFNRFTGKEVGRFTGLAEPVRANISPGAFAAHGISSQDLLGRGPFPKQDFLRFIGSDPIVGHNISSFDIPILERTLGRKISNPLIDTLRMAKEAVPGLSSYQQEALAEHFGLSNQGRHRALNDVLENIDLYRKLQFRSPLRKVLSKTSLGLGILGAGLLVGAPLIAFSGRDDNYNTITGLPEGGMGGRLRKENTDFGSGYQDDETSSNVLAGVFGIGAGIGGYSYFTTPYRSRKQYSKFVIANQKGMVTEDVFRARGRSFVEKVIQSTLSGRSYGGSVERAAGEYGKGAAIWNYDILSGEVVDPNDPFISSPRQRPMTQADILNWGDWDLGVSKLKTWEYLDKYGMGKYHVPTMSAQEAFDILTGPNLIGGAMITPTTKGRELFGDFSGLDNLVIKEDLSAQSQGVWLGKKPKKLISALSNRPQDFLVQPKLDLLDEYRVITAQGKPLFAAHRWGVGPVRAQNVLPVISHRSELMKFTEEVASNLPLDIAAFDIGRTEEGFKIIEIQKKFGTLKNPAVSRRLASFYSGQTPITGIIAGLGLGLSVYSLFSGKDDEYNTIEGLRHEGMAQDKRRELTDFGSGWRGLFGGISRKITKYLGKPTEKLLSPTRAAKMSLEELAGGKALIIGDDLRSATWFAELQKRTGDFGGAAYIDKLDKIVFNPTKLREQFYQAGLARGMKADIVQEAIESDDFLRTVMYHEVLERQTMGGIKKMMPAAHHSSHVLIGEAGFLEQIQNPNVKALFKTIRGARKEEAASFALGETLFSGRDDAYNTIQGFWEKGIGAKLRKIFTDFGSGWDPLRGIAKKLGMSLDDIIASPEWKRALEESEIVGTIGKGASGVSYHRRASFRGHAVDFVEKEISKPDPNIPWNVAQRETEILRKLEGKSIFPTLYGTSKGSLGESIFMEMMPGKSLTRNIGSSARKQVNDAIHELSRKGIHNPDIHAGNILVDKDRVGMIDFGLAYEVRPEFREQSLERMKQRFSEAISNPQEVVPVLQEELIERNIISKAPPSIETAQTNLHHPAAYARTNIQANNQMKTQQQMFENATSGRNHRNARQSKVSHPSHFAGTETKVLKKQQQVNGTRVINKRRRRS